MSLFSFRLVSSVAYVVLNLYKWHDVVMMYEHSPREFVLAGTALVHHADSLCVYQPCMVGIILASDKFMPHDDKVHSSLKRYVVVKGLTYKGVVGRTLSQGSVIYYMSGALP